MTEVTVVRVVTVGKEVTEVAEVTVLTVITVATLVTITVKNNLKKDCDKKEKKHFQLKKTLQIIT